jgi:hypothetical protein
VASWHDGHVDPETEPVRDRERRERAALHEKRATDAITSIMNGGDLTVETMALANQFTDETAARVRRRLGLGPR